jgi:hypothetical protein
LADPGKNDSCSTEIEAQSKYTELRQLSENLLGKRSGSGDARLTKGRVKK